MGSDGVRAKNGQKLELDLLYNSDSVTEKTISEYLQSEYLKLGISLNIHGEEEQSYRDNMKAGNFDMVFNICWGMPYDPSPLWLLCGPRCMATTLHSRDWRTRRRSIRPSRISSPPPMRQSVRNYMTLF